MRWRRVVDAITLSRILASVQILKICRHVSTASRQGNDVIYLVALRTEAVDQFNHGHVIGITRSSLHTSSITRTLRPLATNIRLRPITRKLTEVFRVGIAPSLTGCAVAFPI